MAKSVPIRLHPIVATPHHFASTLTRNESRTPWILCGIDSNTQFLEVNGAAVEWSRRNPSYSSRFNRTYATLVRAGVYYYDEEGRRYLDGSGGSSSVTNIGHGVKEVADAVYKQISTLAYAPTHTFTTEPIEQLAKLIIENFAPEGMDRVWFVSGGSEAVESAIKMALQYHRDRGKPTSGHLTMEQLPRFDIRCDGRQREYASPTEIPADAATVRAHSSLLSIPLLDKFHMPGLRDAISPAPTSWNTPFGNSDQKMSQHFIAEPVVGATLQRATSVSGLLPGDPPHLRQVRRPLHR